MKTRIKICGLTRAQDVDAAVNAGADALGFVFYPESPRYVSPETAAELVLRIPPFITRVGLFVNPERAWVEAVLSKVALHVLQFHGDETEAFCASFQRPFIKAARMKTGFDLLQFSQSFPLAEAILLDAFSEGFGGSGLSFDWSWVPKVLPKPIILSGGLHAGNVGAGIQALRPAAIDVSSGVEISKGLKDHAKIEAFIKAVHAIDES